MRRREFLQVPFDARRIIWGCVPRRASVVQAGKLLKQFCVLVGAGFTPLKRCVNEMEQS